MTKSLTKTDRNYILINVVIVAYFVLLFVVNLYRIDFVLIGVFRELLTIPFLIAQVVALIIEIKHVIKNKTHYMTIISMIGLSICAIYTFGGFIKWN